MIGERKHPLTLSIISSVVFARWQHYIRQWFALSGNGKETFNAIMDPDADPDNHQNLITSKFGPVGPSLTYPENFSQISP